MDERPPPAAVISDRRRKAVTWVIATAAVYLIALWYLDRDKAILTRLVSLSWPLAGCCLLVLSSYLIRFQRWRTLMAAQGIGRRSWGHGLLAYLAGFAFTASPGKAGELLRIRYFGWQGVPARVTLSTFIYERALDLAVITLMAVGAATLIPLFGGLVAIVAAILVGVTLLALWPPFASSAQALARRLPAARLRQLAGFIIDGGTGLRPLLRAPLILSGLASGTLAWGLTTAAFATLCVHLEIELPWVLIMGIYPLAMLVGALSFVPGGVGTTEAAIVLMLAAAGVGMDVALTAAIGIRLASLWLAVLVGMLAVAVLEFGATPVHTQ